MTKDKAAPAVKKKDEDDDDASPVSINASIDAKAGLALPLRLAAAARSNRSVSPVCTIPIFSCPPDLNVASFTGSPLVFR